MDNFISVDFETRSTVDLRRSGVYPYAQDPTTDVWCVAYLMPSESEPRVWRPGDPIDQDFAGWVAAGRPLRAWNAQFERVIWNEIMTARYGWPETAIEQWFCSAAEARAMALPGALGDAAAALGAEQQKDKQGANLMMRMARPRKVHEDGRLEWWDVPDRVQRLVDYCKQDVRTETGILKQIQRLSPTEREVFVLDQRINDRGVRFDRELATAAREVAQIALLRANTRLQRVTQGNVPGVTSVGQFTAWVRGRGVECESLTKDSVREMLSGDLPDDVREALRLREEAGKSSVAKIEAMFEAACDDDRVRGLLMYHGASTGRWSGRLVQPQNFPRGEVKKAERFIPQVLARDVDGIDFEYPVLDVISSLLRPMLTASEGKALVAADFSAIEARVLAWLAGEEWRLEVFRGHGKIYEASASMMFGAPLDLIVEGRPEYALRQKGKVGELALGYYGGVGALRAMGGAEMGLSEPEMKEIVTRWREKSPAIVALWHELEAAALAAVRKPGTQHHAGHGRVTFKASRGYLWMRLPSGRKLCYSRPEVVERTTPWGSTVEGVRVWGVNSVTRKWQQTNLYSGLYCENAVQAIARDILVEAMLRAEANGYPVVMSVHDEIVAEVDEARADVAELEQLMNVVPKWAEGLPLASEGWSGFRYRK